MFCEEGGIMQFGPSAKQAHSRSKSDAIMTRDMMIRQEKKWKLKLKKKKVVTPQSKPSLA